MTAAEVLERALAVEAALDPEGHVRRALEPVAAFVVEAARAGIVRPHDGPSFVDGVLPRLRRAFPEEVRGLMDGAVAAAERAFGPWPREVRAGCSWLRSEAEVAAAWAEVTRAPGGVESSYQRVASVPRIGLEISGPRVAP